MPINLTCLHCKYYMKNLECKAFDSIPFEVLSGKLEHNKIFKNQVGNFVFEKN